MDKIVIQQPKVGEIVITKLGSGNISIDQFVFIEPDKAKTVAAALLDIAGEGENYANMIDFLTVIADIKNGKLSVDEAVKIITGNYYIIKYQRKVHQDKTEERGTCT